MIIAHCISMPKHFTGEVRVSYLITCRLVLLYITDVQTVSTRERGEKPFMHIYRSKTRLWEPLEHQ